MRSNASRSSETHRARGARGSPVSFSDPSPASRAQSRCKFPSMRRAPDTCHLVTRRKEKETEEGGGSMYQRRRPSPENHRPWLLLIVLKMWSNACGIMPIRPGSRPPVQHGQKPVYQKQGKTGKKGQVVAACDCPPLVRNHLLEKESLPFMVHVLPVPVCP